MVSNRLIRYGERQLINLGLVANTAQAIYVLDRVVATGRSVSRFIHEASQVGSSAARRAQRLAEQYNYQIGPVRDNLDRKGLFMEVDHPMITNSTASASTGYVPGDVPSDRQYTAYVRNSKSRFGRKKRFTKAVIKRELKQDDFTLRSRFQEFYSDNGFAAGLGGISCTYRTPNTNVGDVIGVFPFHIFDVTSLPCAFEGATVAMPIRHYTLGFHTTNFSAREFNRFGWVPRKAGTETPAAQIDASYANQNIAVIQNTNGYHPNDTAHFNLRVPTAKGFKHEWSNIKLVMYPPEGMPVKWHVALISFPDSLVNGNNLTTAGPGLGYSSSGVYASKLGNTSTYSIYNPRSASSEGDGNNLDLRWQKFWSGKLLNPINQDQAGINPDNPTNSNDLPFKIIKHTSFMQPARDNPDFGGNAQRHIHKLFYRRDWQFSPAADIEQEDIGEAMGNIDKVQLQATAGVPNFRSSPYPKPSEIVYLAVWCECYKSFANGFDADSVRDSARTQVAAEPGFDICVQMKHSMNTHNMSSYSGAKATPPVPP